MDSASDIINQVIHKEKSSKKENKRTKGHMPYGHMEGSTTQAKTQEANGYRSVTDVTAKRREAAKIDEYLYGLVMEGLIDPKFLSWHAKGVYTLTIMRYNALVIVARRGREPSKLLAVKVKQALLYHQDLLDGVE